MVADTQADLDFYIRLRLGAQDARTEICRGSLTPRFMKDFSLKVCCKRCADQAPLCGSADCSNCNNAVAAVVAGLPPVSWLNHQALALFIIPCW